MNNISGNPPPRTVPPEPEATVVHLSRPPRLGDAPPMAGSAGMILVPAASGVGAVMLAVTHQDRPLLAVAGLLVLAASITVGVIMVVSQRTGTRRRTRDQRERYLDYLEQMRGRARVAAAGQRRAAGLLHPDPRAAAGMAWVPGRRWERAGGDADFLLLRAGVGAVPLAGAPVLPVDDQDPLADDDPVCRLAADQLAGRYGELADQPVCLPLAAASVVTVVGRPDGVIGVTRALLAQLIWSHSPADVAVLVCSADRSGTWDWLKWLPHSLSDEVSDGPLPVRLITDRVPGVLDLLSHLHPGGGPADGGRVGNGPAGLAQAGGGWAGGDQDGGFRTRSVIMVMDALPEGLTAELRTVVMAARTVGARVVCLVGDRRDEPDLVDLRVVVGADQEDGAADERAPDRLETASGGLTPCRLDHLDAADAQLLARSFAPLRMASQKAESAGVAAEAADPLQIGDPATIDPAVTWRARPGSDLLRVPIGIALDTADQRGALPDSVLVLDLKEAACGGMGPHGLVVGATGSGKSELLRTLVTALAITHPPATLALLLADFKGGATFSGFDALPHVAGMITNLEADLSLVDRFRDALGGELQRRQELLAAAGKLTSLQGYLVLRQRRPDLEPMPHLLVVVDEFSELLGVRPDLAELFVTIGRIGRSIGIHLLLATQRLDTGRIRGLESHLSYRICLRTFSESESREAIGGPEAYDLPPEPGSAYLRAGTAGLRRFRVASVSRPYRTAPPIRATPTTAPATSGPVAQVLPFGPTNGLAARISTLHRRPAGSADGLVDQATVAGRRTDDHARTVLDVAVERLRVGGRDLSLGQPVRRIWLDPLPARLTLADLLARNDSRAGLGPVVSGVGESSWDSGGPVHSDPDLRSPGKSNDDGSVPNTTGSDGGTFDPIGSGALIAHLGLVDVPVRQRQDVLSWDFTQGNGNLLIVGSGRSGKTTAVHTLLLSLAHRHSPAAVQFVCIDLGGQSLQPYGALPHVAAVATRGVPELTRRVFGRVIELLTERETPGGRHRRDATGGRIVIVIDGWPGPGGDDGAMDDALHEILRRGPGVGVHTVLTVDRPGALRARLANGFAGRIELRLTDSFDSAIDRHLAKAMPAIAGRALVAGGHFAQFAVPAGGTDTAVASIRRRWPGAPVPLLRQLPPMVPLAGLLAAIAGRRRVPAGVLLGVSEGDLAPVHHDFAGDDPHLVVYGDAGAGKTMVLRSLLTQLPMRPGAARPGAVRPGPAPTLWVVDYRRGLTTEVAAGGHRSAAGAAQASAICDELVTELSTRLRSGAGRPEPRLYLLVDDYDLVCAGAGNPLGVLVPYLPHARDLGFHLVLVRRTGGAARAQYEPLLQTLGDLGTPVLLLSGSPVEGRLTHGLVPRLLPPGRGQLAMRGAAAQVIQTAHIG